MVEERSKSTGDIVFNQPAGHLEDNEGLVDAVIRETREETCRHFTPEAFTGLYRLRTSSGKTYIRYTFCGEISELDQSLTLDGDIITTHWMSLDQLRQHSALRSDLVLACIDDYLEGIRHPLSLIRDL